MRVAEIGDNCIDLYERIGRKYPTGNVVDTGVNLDRKSTRLNSSHPTTSRMPSSA